jgi:hypothetical protein
MKKVIIFLLLLSLIACTKKEPIDPVNITSGGNSIFFPFIDLKKASKNIDLLELSHSALALSRNSTFYIMPVRYEKLGKVSFEDNYTTMIKNYIILNALGYIVESREQADYYIILSAKESITSYLSENFSLLELNIFTKMDIPVFHIKMKVTSNRDNNFYYHPSTASNPPDYLTQTGLIYLLDRYFKKLFEGGR